MFDAISWAYSFVEFFYGDTVPNHPLRTSHGKNNSHFKSVGWQRHFATLAVREELEYTLDSDAVPYKARQMSRFDTPEFMMIFASTLRSMHMLQSSKLSILNGNLAHTFWADLKTIAECRVDDFERVLSQQQRQGAQTLIQVFQSPKLSEEHRTVHTALKQLLMQTATVPLTEGNKIKARRQSFALTLHFGPLKLFLTCNFADTYSPITLLLYAGKDSQVNDEDGPLLYHGQASVNLFEESPNMPTLQRMHQIVARHPVIQARLFMLMERLTHHELLCGHRVVLGSVGLESPDPKCSMFQLEDDYASDGQPGLANFMTSLIAPLEAQGRGFEHAHKKVTGVPSTKIAELEKLFQESDDTLKDWMVSMRDAVLKAADTIQYESAIRPAQQLNVEVLPEPFSKQQQARSRLDGGLG